MKKILIIFIFLFLFITDYANAMTSKEYVAHLEQQLFGGVYENDNIDQRIDRIEMQIYDNRYSGNPEQRLQKIYKIYPQSSFEEPQNITQNTSNTNENISDNFDEEERAAYNNYPIVSEIEHHIYNKDYSGEDIYKRLDRIENELYGHVNKDKSLQERVANLKSIMPKKRRTESFAQNYEFENFDINQNQIYGKKNYNSDAILAQIELQTFNKSFSNENNDTRLQRLEHFYFGNVYSDKNDDERLAKLASALVKNNHHDYFQIPQGSQWAGLLINLLMIGLGFLL